jgi:hypothetical protein
MAINSPSASLDDQPTQINSHFIRKEACTFLAKSFTVSWHVLYVCFVRIYKHCSTDAMIHVQRIPQGGDRRKQVNTSSHGAIHHGTNNHDHTQQDSPSKDNATASTSHGNGNDTVILPTRRGGFPTWLRDVIEPHIEKCRVSRARAVSSANAAAKALPHWRNIENVENNARTHSDSECSPPSQYDDATRERDMAFDVSRHGLREAFCLATCCRSDVDLGNVHAEADLKENMMSNLLDREKNRHFQLVYDEFVSIHLCTRVCNGC